MPDAGFNCKEKEADLLFAVAVSVAVCAVVTPYAVAVKVPVFAPDATFTDDGTDTAPLLELRVTVRPLLPAAALRVTVQLSLTVPDTEPLTHVKLAGVAAPYIAAGRQTARTKSRIVPRAEKRFARPDFSSRY